METRTAGGRTHVHFKIWRQETTDHEGRFEEFKVPYAKGANVISCLMEIQRNPVTAEGKRTTPVVWDSNCLEEVCGSCTVNINGRVRMACSSLVDHLAEPIVLEPLQKFPLVRDLAVDRSRMFDALKQVTAWLNIDGTHDLGPGPRQSQGDQAVMYVLSTCMTCACCLEACPQVQLGNAFMGAAAISQARLFNMNPSGKMNADDRLSGLMERGGVQDCGKAQNCVEVCPKEIPLTTSIAAMNREVTKLLFRRILSLDLPSARAAAGPG
ncbi:MAG: succinate dehydrogenase iron-sulfur subunit [Myxococcales bacterium]|nr:succinate dehydrogenase iron-sulfur subunit [Myxococcales bacterium]